MTIKSINWFHLLVLRGGIFTEGQTMGISLKCRQKEREELRDRLFRQHRFVGPDFLGLQEKFIRVLE